MTIDIHRVRLVATELRGRIVVAALRYGCQEKGYWDSTLGGLCGVASDLLVRELHKYGIVAELVFGQFLYNGRRDGGHHCWVECGGYRIDLTATQFDDWLGPFPEVFITSAMSIQDEEHHGLYFTKMRGMRAYDHITHDKWPDDARPGALDMWLESVGDACAARETT